MLESPPSNLPGVFRPRPTDATELFWALSIQAPELIILRRWGLDRRAENRFAKWLSGARSRPHLVLHSEEDIWHTASLLSPVFELGTGRPSDDLTPYVHAHVGRTVDPVGDQVYSSFSLTRAEGLTLSLEIAMAFVHAGYCQACIAHDLLFARAIGSGNIFFVCAACTAAGLKRPTPNLPPWEQSIRERSQDLAPTGWTLATRSEVEEAGLGDQVVSDAPEICEDLIAWYPGFRYRSGGTVPNH